MSLTDRQKQLIRDSWSPVTKDFTGNGIIMFQRLFGKNPQLQPLFTWAKGVPVSDIGTLPKLQKHATTVLKTVDTAVAHLDDLAAVVPKLITLGAYHAKHNIKPAYFEPVGESLVYAIAQVNGDGFTDEIKEAWIGVYSVVVETMQKGLAEATAKRSQKVPIVSLTEGIL